VTRDDMLMQNRYNDVARNDDDDGGDVLTQSG
jgi:hypothetical protein